LPCLPVTTACATKTLTRRPQTVATAVETFAATLETHRWLPTSAAARARRPPAQEGENKDTGPPYALMEAPPLALFANGLAAALNELRHCPPLVLQGPVTAVVQARVALGPLFESSAEAQPFPLPAVPPERAAPLPAAGAAGPARPPRRCAPVLSVSRQATSTNSSSGCLNALRRCPPLVLQAVGRRVRFLSIFAHILRYFLAVPLHQASPQELRHCPPLLLRGPVHIRRGIGVSFALQHDTSSILVSVFSPKALCAAVRWRRCRSVRSRAACAVA